MSRVKNEKDTCIEVPSLNYVPCCEIEEPTKVQTVYVDFEKNQAFYEDGQLMGQIIDHDQENRVITVQRKLPFFGLGEEFTGQTLKQSITIVYK